jgi:hypothetical protein
MEKIFYNLLLVQDHLSLDPCANCLTKHLSTILAYNEEGASLDNADKVHDLFVIVHDEIPKILAIVRNCAVGDRCDIKRPEDMDNLVQSVRHLRREVGKAIYGIDSDVVHDITDESAHRQTYEHELADHEEREESHAHEAAIHSHTDGIEDHEHR